MWIAATQRVNIRVQRLEDLLWQCFTELAVE